MQVARASNPGGTTAIWVRDRLDGLWCDEDFADWYPRDGRPGLSPAQLATVCGLQFLLGLSDRQAAEAVRCRIDFKYAMAMELDDPGFHHSVWPTSATVSLKATVPTASSTSRWPVSRRPDWCESAPLSAPTPPTFWPRCAT
ncbi:transposase [Streptomyces mirabilis]|uniref:transposase n=1 Tax=Streptomyces mirabilis TaxID=68239 RepID=UPI0033D0DC33